MLAPALVKTRAELRTALEPALLADPHKIEPPGSAPRGHAVGSLRSLITRANRRGQVLVCAVVSSGEALAWLAPLLHALVDSSGPISGCSVQVFASAGDAVAGPEPARTIAGFESIDEQVGTVSVRLHPLAFFQVNPFVLDSLISTIHGLALRGGSESQRLLDLYCGGGALGLSLAATDPTRILLTGVDIDERAIGAARENASQAGLDAHFEAGAAADLLPALRIERGPFDLIVVDPPRRGLRAAAMTEIEAAAANKILYVSCHSASLARDALLLEQAGYRAQALVPLDMLPQTAHVEWVALFAR